MQNYIRTDLAAELPDYRATKRKKIGKVEIEEASTMGKRMITVSCSRLWLWDKDDIEDALGALCEIITELSVGLLDAPIGRQTSVLVAGLGNRALTADSFGTKTADGVVATYHALASPDGALSRLGCSAVSVIAPGTLAQTGIESAVLIRRAAESVGADLIIAVDSLAARSLDRLASTVQLSDSGLCPGSGVGNRRMAIDPSSMGRPVISIGVPTVTDSSTMVIDALERAGIDGIPKELEEVLENGRSFFVSPRDTDILTDRTAQLVSKSINRVFGVDF